MSVTSGFFNSVNGDRRYDARQMSALFDGIITDGIFANIGNTFNVVAYGGDRVIVGPGRAWFNRTWINNDATLSLTLDVSEVLLGRYDAVVIEVDRSDAVRNGSIKIVKGTPASSPVYPILTHTNEVDQYPLAYIYRAAGSTAVSQANITNAIGTSECPYITGILQVQNIDNVVAQWEAQWIEWYNAQTADMVNWTDAEKAEWEAGYEALAQEFNDWFDTIKGVLGDDVAGSLAERITVLESKIANLSSSLTPEAIGALPADGGTATNFSVGNVDSLGDPGIRFEDMEGDEIGHLIAYSDHFARFNRDGDQWAMLDAENYPDFISPETIGAVAFRGDLNDPLLTKATSLSSGVHNFNLGGSGYTGNDLPHSNYKYGTATVFVRAQYITVVLWGLNVTGAEKVQINYRSNSGWTGWQGLGTGEHTHSPADINTAGTLGAQVKANVTAQATLGTAQLRDVYMGTGELTAGTSSLTAGTIYIQYE